MLLIGGESQRWTPFLRSKFALAALRDAGRRRRESNASLVRRNPFAFLRVAFPCNVSMQVIYTMDREIARVGGRFAAIFRSWVVDTTYGTELIEVWRRRCSVYRVVRFDKCQVVGIFRERGRLDAGERSYGFNARPSKELVIFERELT